MFPAPMPSYSSSGFIGELIYVPKYARDELTGEIIQFSSGEADSPEMFNSAAQGAELDRSKSP